MLAKRSLFAILAIRTPKTLDLNMSTAALAALPLSPKGVNEDVWTYPRPPALERVQRSVEPCIQSYTSKQEYILTDLDYSRLQVIWVAKDGQETVLADTTSALRVLETR